MPPHILTLLLAGLLCLGCWQLSEGAWIYAKAGLAQLLLQRAWSRALQGEADPKPWPWADTSPIARLRAPGSGVDMIVLSGAYGRTLAFGPGHLASSALPHQPGTMVVTGHRDTHFRFLRDLKRNDRLEITGTDGRTRRYAVTESQVMDSRRDSFLLADTGHELILVTCYPFDAVRPGGPLRYVVRAEEAG